MVLYDPAALSQSTRAQSGDAQDPRCVQVTDADSQLGLPNGRRACSWPFVMELLDSISFYVERSPTDACAVAIELVRLLTPPDVAKSPGTRGGLAPWQRRKVDDYIRANLAHPPRVD